MKTKEGFARLTVMIPKDHYNRLLQRKLLNGTSMSLTLTEALERWPEAGNKKFSGERGEHPHIFDLDLRDSGFLARGPRQPFPNPAHNGS